MEHSNPLLMTSLTIPPSSCSMPNPLAPVRRKSRKIHVGDVAVGGDAPVSVQSMLTNDTRDIEESVNQIARLADAGCQIIRLAVPDKEAAEALKLTEHEDSPHKEDAK